MKIRLLSPAAKELVAAARYYENQAQGLGGDFLIEAQKVVAGIERNPLLCAKIHGEIRRRMFKRFPYAALYRIESGEIIILAIMHLHRSPDYWYKR